MRTRSSQKEPLVDLTNEQLAELERTNNRAKRSNTSTTEMNHDINNQGAPPGPPFLNQVPPPPGGHAGAPPEIIAQYEARMQEQNNALLLLQQQMQQMMLQNNRPRGRTIGEADNINDYYQNRSAIVIPPIPAGERRNAELRPSTISLVKQSAFHGLSNENPLKHIEEFEALCDTTQATGACLEYFRCSLFQFSLAGKAEQWLRSLPPGSLTSWAQCKAAFLKQFYTKGRTAQLRSKITTFRQADGESFSEAWERLKEYIRECPHHGFQQEQIYRIFYDGIDWQYKIALNSASRGDFSTQDVEGAKELIENMAESFDGKGPEYDRTRKVNSVSTPSLEELQAQVQELLRASGTQKEVHMVGEPETGYYQEAAGSYVENAEEVSYVSGQGFGQNRGFQNYRNHPNLSYRSTNVANPQDQIYPPATQGQQQQQNKPFVPNVGYQNQQNQGFQNYQNQQSQGYQNNYAAPYQPRPYNNQGQNNQQAYAPRAPQQVQNVPYPQQQQQKTTLDDIKALFFNGQLEIQKGMNDIKSELQSTKNEIESKLDALETRVKMAETQVAQTAENAKRQPGTLPGKGENPRRDMCAVVKTPRKDEALDCDVELETAIEEEKVEKLGDPGPLNLQVEIEGKFFSDCLCDLGASVNLMSYTAAKSIGLQDYEPTNISLRFADSSEKKPLGMAVDVPVRINKALVPTDFVVLDLVDKSRETVILGRPFLNSTGAVINTREGSVVLDLTTKNKSLKVENQSIDPGDTKTSNLVSVSQRKGQQGRKVQVSDLRSSSGEDEWLKRKPNKGSIWGWNNSKIQLESESLLQGKAGSTSHSGSGSVTRPPDHQRW